METKERTRQDWLDHLYKIMDISNQCMNIWKDCEQCIAVHGACRRNMAILEMRYVIHEYFDLLVRTITVDLSRVVENEDGNVIVGDPNAGITFNGEALTKLLTMKGDTNEYD